MRRTSIAWVLTVLASAATAGGQGSIPLDEAPARAGEWGYRPGEGTVVKVTPPGFCWRPERHIVAWELEVGEGRSFDKVIYRAGAIRWNVHCPPRAFPPGAYAWRYRGHDRKGRTTAWSRTRAFRIDARASALPLPSRQELLARIPAKHPRLFLRPDDVEGLRALARGRLKREYRALKQTCEKLLRSPPPTEEPPKYPPGTARKSEAWRTIWWGNRTYTIRALNAAATLAFTRLLDGNEDYGRLARRLLLDCAGWDPKGATGYRYNDEAGMPYAYYFSRTYSFLHDLLDEQERERCRRVMTVRGREMFRHLCPGHLWRPYASHSNRAWHFLGEVGIAFHGEIPEAADWVWFAANVFACVYPVWCDDDGGWHEGSSYWSSYLGRFTWWADVMRAALGIDAYQKPFFSQAGYYALYLMPPGKLGGGFGDLTATRRARQNVPLVTTLAGQAGNPHWQWYVERLGGPRGEKGYIGFLRGRRPEVKAAPPDDLPASRLFRGTGQAVLNTTLARADDGVQVVFKSSPFGTQSHGYEANNSFLLWAYGRRLLIRTGRRDVYGSEHHRRWMWSTRSVNCITVNGQGQVPRSVLARGEITAFKTTPRVDVVVGEAGRAYRVTRKGRAVPLLDRFTRTLVFIKPDLILVHDRLAARQPSTFTYWLHAVNRIDVKGQREIRVKAGDVQCAIDLVMPSGLTFSQTNEYDPNPRPRVKLREWHLAASTPEPERNVEFLAVYRPHRVSEALTSVVEALQTSGGSAIRVGSAWGVATVLFPAPGGQGLDAYRLKATDAVVVRLTDRERSVVQELTVPLNEEH